MASIAYPQGLKKIRKLTYRFIPWCEPHVVHRAPVSRQLVYQFPRPTLPHTYAPIAAPDADFVASAVPAGSDEISLHADGRAGEGSYGAIDGCEGADVPGSCHSVVGIGEEGLAVGGDAEGGYGVGVSGHAVRDGFLPDVISVYRAIDAAGVDFISCFGDGDGRDGEVRFYKIDRSFDAWVPYPHTSVIGAAE